MFLFPKPRKPENRSSMLVPGSLRPRLLFTSLVLIESLERVDPLRILCRLVRALKWDYAEESVETRVWIVRRTLLSWFNDTSRT